VPGGENMKKSIYVVLLIWLIGNIFIPGPVASDEVYCQKIYHKKLNRGFYNTRYYDGYAWNSLSEQDKLMYINGLWVGLDMNRDILIKNSSPSDPVQKQFLFFQNRVIKHVGWYINSWRLNLNKFYENPNNYDVTIYSAIYRIAGLEEKK
jgi:hypothetical protein